jgi:hypothetical protein
MKEHERLRIKMPRRRRRFDEEEDDSVTSQLRERSIPQITKDPNSQRPGHTLIQASADFEEEDYDAVGGPSISILFFTVSWPVTKL